MSYEGQMGGRTAATHMAGYGLVRNQWGGKCYRCGAYVPAGGGLRVQTGLKGWQTRHAEGECEDTPLLAEFEAEKARLFGGRLG